MLVATQNENPIWLEVQSRNNIGKVEKYIERRKREPEIDFTEKTQ